MADIKLVPVRATVVVGSLSASTPYVVSFNVNRARGQSGTFNATIKVHYSQLANTVGGDVTINAGPEGSTRRIFTGICRSSNVTPCRDDPSYIMLTVSGDDILSELKNKKITRRCKSSAATWVEITGVVRPGLKSTKLAYQKRTENIKMDPITTRDEDPVTHTTAQSVPGSNEINRPKSEKEDQLVNLTAEIVDAANPTAQ